jgi:uncharacterized protein (TIGR00369 family)
MKPMKAVSSERKNFLTRDYRQGFVAFCGLQVDRIGAGVFESHVTIRKHHRQQDGFIHAGLLATMADHTAGYAAFTLVPAEYQILTIEFKINFFRPAAGSRLECRSRVIRRGERILVAESEVYDLTRGKKDLAAKATVTLMAVLRTRLRGRGEKARASRRGS